MTTPAETCRTCDGLGYTETAAPDSRVIHHEPCPDCAAASTTPAARAAMNPGRAAGRRLWETLRASVGIEGYLDYWWQFSWDDLPAELHDDLVDAALRSRQAERDALCAALVAEYAAALARSGFWRDRWSDDVERTMACAGARDALLRVAERLGVGDLRARAAEVVARGAEDEEG